MSSEEDCEEFWDPLAFVLADDSTKEGQQPAPNTERFFNPPDDKQSVENTTSDADPNTKNEPDADTLQAQDNIPPLASTEHEPLPWDTSSVVDMRSTFNGAAKSNQYLSGWGTSRLMEMNLMFIDTLAFNGAINSWNTVAVTDISGMFQNPECNRLQSRH